MDDFPFTARTRQAACAKIHTPAVRHATALGREFLQIALVAMNAMPQQRRPAMSKPFTTSRPATQRIQAFVTTFLSCAVVVLLGAVQIGVLTA